MEPYLLLPELAAQQGGVAFAADGWLGATRLIAGAANTVSVVDLTSGGTVREYTSYGRVRCVAISKLGQLVLFGGFDKTVSYRVLDHGANLTHFECPGTVKSVHLSANASCLAVGGDDGSGGGFVKYYDALTNNLLASWKHPKEVWSVRISPDLSYIAAAGYDSKLYLYDAAKLTLAHTEPPYHSFGPPAFVWTSCWSADASPTYLPNEDPEPFFNWPAPCHFRDRIQRTLAMPM